MDYQLQEGSITLPEGFQDRTVNMFVLGNSIPAPLNITLSRDNLLPAEDMKAYIDRQVKLIAAKLRGYTLLGKKPAQLSARKPNASMPTVPAVSLVPTNANTPASAAIETEIDVKAITPAVPVFAN